MGFVDRYKTPVKKRSSWKEKFRESVKDTCKLIGLSDCPKTVESRFKARVEEIGLKLIKGGNRDKI